VISQFVVIALVALAPRNLSSLPEWSSSFKTVGSFAGGLMMLSGLSLATAGALKLGHNLTPFICPKENSVLLEKGAYRIVRHPIYAGLLQMAFGWGLWVAGWLTLCYAIILFIIFDRKSRREEEFLLGMFPEYGSYSRRVKRLIPFIY
jgi:protein-S-isoprenylcysteine O-methyltransferase Ste14